MKKNYSIFTIALFFLMMAIGVSAQTTMYLGLQDCSNDWENGMNGCIAGFNITDPSKVVEVPIKFEVGVFEYPDGVMDELTYVQSGTGAGDKYYAMTYTYFANECTFCTLNFTTGKQTNLGVGSMELTDMAYDATNKVLYGVESYMSDGAFTTVIYSINEGNGELTEVYKNTDLRIVAIASNGNQKLYGVQIVNGEASLYSIDPVNGEASKLHTLGQVSDVYTYSLEMNEGSLYLVNGSEFFTIDPVEGTMTISENSLPQSSMVGLTFVKSSADGVPGEVVDPDPVDNRRVRVVETWGDSMGDETGKCTQREVTYYDADNNPQRTALYGKLLGQDVWQISRFQTYEYNDKKQLVQTSSEQYGVYDGEDMAFKAASDTVKYEYNAEGRMSKETTSNGGYIAYKYDSDGNLTEKARYNPDRYDEYEGDYYVVESYVYSDFIAPNCPQTIKGDGAYDSYKTLCKVTYDDKKNKIVAKTYDITGETLRMAEYWTYEEGNLTLYLRKSVDDKGQEVDDLRTTYSFDNNNPNRIKEVTESYYAGEWAGTPVYRVTEYSDYDAMFATELTVTPQADALNTMKLTFTVPNVPAFGGIAFDIYRHGIMIKRVLPSDEGALDPETGTISYTDTRVKNGNYDYFVQTVLLPEMEEDPEEAFNISNVVRTKIYTELPAVTNVHYISHKTEDKMYVVTIGWDAPAEDVSALGFQRYNVFVKGFKMAENREEDGQATTFDVKFGDTSLKSSKEKEIIIQTVYELGKIDTEPKLINIDQVAIENNEMDELVQFNGEQIIINSDNASVEIISMNGAVLNSYQNVKNVDLSTLDKGVYLVKIACAGKVYVSKIVK